MGKTKRRRSVSSSSRTSGETSLSSSSYDSRDREILKLRKKILSLKKKKGSRGHRRSPKRRRSLSQTHTSPAAVRETKSTDTSNGKQGPRKRVLLIDSSTEEENNRFSSEGEEEEPQKIHDSILKVLGRREQEENFSTPVLQEIATQWNQLLKKGLEEEDREKLTQKYKVPENCTSAAPPRLNAEVKAAINETTLKRDQRLEKVQKQMGASLSALGKAITLLVTPDEPERHIEPLKP